MSKYNVIYKQNFGAKTVMLIGCICLLNYHIYLRQGGYVISGICVSASNFIKATDLIFMTVLPEICLWTRKIPLNFASYPYPDPNLGILWRNFQHCKTVQCKTISTICLVCLANVIQILNGKVYQKFIFGQGSTLNFQVIWTWSTLAKVCTLQVLMFCFDH